MIKTRIGTTELNGSYAEIMADYMAITDSLFNFLVEKMGMDESKAEECEVTVINANTPKEIREVLDKVFGKTQKKEGEE